MTLVMTDEQQSFVEAMRDFAARECGTREQREELTEKFTEQHNQDLYRRFAELGWVGVAIPEEYGGGGGGVVDLCLLLEESTRGLMPIAGMSVSLIVAGAYERFGTEEQKADMLGAINRGDVMAIAMSEPESGSDVGSLRCKARRDNGSYVISGHKTWISAAQHAERILLIARTDDSGAKHEGISMIEVPADAEGITIRGIDTMGGREVNDVFFDDVVVPAENLVGVEGGGWMQLMAGLNVERLIIAANMVGLAQRAFDDTLAYVKERKQFGRPIGSFQALRHRIADLGTELECARLITYDTAEKVDAAPDALFPREASMAKLKATEVAKQVTLEGMQMMGGYGYASEYDMEGYVRTALVSTIYGGTNEIQREIVSKTYGL
ncbi:MAG: acyl-CoA/acyl-ACP dehydrogenase [Solirubrobacteraceae bacterium]|jgi:alkylation response protein AidB-like acyl-CoA dehydrogenase|nr:acyl-CoA/acyl-ACP dehydrogenase [Solirubrobacteraceae bacterium]